MGNPKQKWTAEEEEALRAGVRKHGTGKWKNIQKDPEFSHLLNSRSNIDLKVENFYSISVFSLHRIVWMHSFCLGRRKLFNRNA